MQELLIYAGVVVALFALGAIGIYVKRKFDLKNEEVYLIRLILDTVDYITKQFEVKYKDDISRIVEYCFIALDFVEVYSLEDNIEIKKDLVRDKAIDICEKEGINLEDGTVIEIVDKIVDYILAIDGIEEYV